MGSKGGSANKIFNCTFSKNRAEINGGAVYLVEIQSEPGYIIEKCRFVNNYAERNGGGMYISNLKRPFISYTIFAGNYADENYGGGLYTEHSGAWVYNSVFVDNFAQESGGGIYCIGGYFKSINEFPTFSEFINCIIYYNQVGNFSTPS